MEIRKASKIENLKSKLPAKEETMWSRLTSFFNCGNYNSTMNKLEMPLNGELEHITESYGKGLR